MRAFTTIFTTLRFSHGLKNCKSYVIVIPMRKASLSDSEFDYYLPSDKRIR